MTNSYALAYVYGELNIDYIDEDEKEDLISTDRSSLVWGNEELDELQCTIEDIINRISLDWRVKRRESNSKDYLKSIEEFENNTDKKILELKKYAKIIYGIEDKDLIKNIKEGIVQNKKSQILYDEFIKDSLLPSHEFISKFFHSKNNIKNNYSKSIKKVNDKDFSGALSSTSNLLGDVIRAILKNTQILENIMAKRCLIRIFQN